jgi:hypothetical protein
MSSSMIRNEEIEDGYVSYEIHAVRHPSQTPIAGVVLYLTAQFLFAWVKS